MRFFLIALVASLIAVSADAQTPGDSTSIAAAVMVDVAPDGNETDILAVADEEGREADDRAQPSTRNFLYQVLLAAVTALVTALIWKAVF